jgi:hypothetical protein
MAVNGSVLIVPGNKAAQRIFNGLPGTTTGEKLNAFRASKPTGFQKLLGGSKLKDMLTAESLLAKFKEAVKCMNDGNELLEQVQSKHDAGQEVELKVANDLKWNYGRAIVLFMETDNGAQAGYCKEQLSTAEKLLEKKPEEPKQRTAQAPRPGGVRSGRDVATAPERAKVGGTKEWDWRKAHEESGTGTPRF